MLLLFILIEEKRLLEKHLFELLFI